MDVVTNCPCCGKENVVRLTTEQWIRYDLFLYGREHIQDVLPDLSAGERELLMTGICTECWKKLKEDEE